MEICVNFLLFPHFLFFFWVFKHDLSDALILAVSDTASDDVTN